jgi:hypothetical protein
LAQHSPEKYYPTRPPYILHIIGNKGAGTQWFIDEYFPHLPVFDLSAAFLDCHRPYSDELAIASELADSDPLCVEFIQQLQTKWNAFLQRNDPGIKNPEDRTSSYVLLVKSSGRNDPLNTLLVWYFPTVLLIIADGSELAAIDPSLYYTRVFNRKTRCFSGVLDAKFIHASPNLSRAQAAKKISFELGDD